MAQTRHDHACKNESCLPIRQTVQQLGSAMAGRFAARSVLRKLPHTPTGWGRFTAPAGCVRWIGSKPGSHIQPGVGVDEKDRTAEGESWLGMGNVVTDLDDDTAAAKERSHKILMTRLRRSKLADAMRVDKEKVRFVIHPQSLHMQACPCPPHRCTSPAVP